MEKILKKYPVPLRRIQYYRMLARVQILEKIMKALNSLREGISYLLNTIFHIGLVTAAENLHKLFLSITDQIFHYYERPKGISLML